MKILLYILSLPSALIAALIAFACIFGPFCGICFIFIIFTPMGFTFFVMAVVLVLYYFVHSKSILSMGIKVGIPLLIDYASMVDVRLLHKLNKHLRIVSCDEN